MSSGESDMVDGKRGQVWGLLKEGTGYNEYFAIIE